MTVLLIWHLPTFKGRVRERGKAEADSATDREGAECEKTTLLGRRKDPGGKRSGMRRMRGHRDIGKDRNWEAGRQGQGEWRNAAIDGGGGGWGGLWIAPKCGIPNPDRQVAEDKGGQLRRVCHIACVPQRRLS